MTESFKDNQNMAQKLFTDMVMEDAIKDKTQQYMDEQKAQERQFLDNAGKIDNDEEAKDDSDSDFNDDESASYLEQIKEQRMKEMKAKFTQDQENKIKGHGVYSEIAEDEFLPTVTKSKFACVAFYHMDFERCKIIDMHLQKIAFKHHETKFVKLDAEKCPFFVQKLQIQVLPTIVCFMDGVAMDRVTGFEELGGQDEFPTLILTRRLVSAGVIKALNNKEKGIMRITKNVRARGMGEESSSDENHASDDDSY